MEAVTASVGDMVAAAAEPAAAEGGDSASIGGSNPPPSQETRHRCACSGYVIALRRYRRPASSPVLMDAPAAKLLPGAIIQSAVVGDSTNAISHTALDLECDTALSVVCGSRCTMSR